MASGYAVIHVETTGLLSDGHDRVVEVTVVHVDVSGRITGEWDTLVDPSRDLGVRGLRRIRSSDVRLAPTFAQIAPELCALLEGRVVVAHNARFVAGFLCAEFDRADLSSPSTLEQPLCTMHLTRRYLPGVGRSLAQCASALGVVRGDIHSAAVEAWATAELLGRLIRLAPFDPQWALAIELAEAARWPSPEPTGFSWAPRPRAAPAEPAFLCRLTENLPGHNATEQHLDYLALLDRALVDRAFSRRDAAALIAMAESLGIDDDTRRVLHGTYFEQLVVAIRGDESPTAAQLDDLCAVTALLDVDAGSIETTTRASRGA